MNAIRFFLLGVYEFRWSFTTAPPDDWRDTYERGREWAHRLTMRRYES